VNYPVRKVKYLYLASDAGVWGSDPGDGLVDVPVIRSTEISLDGTIRPDGAARRSLTASEARASRLNVGDLLVVRSSGSDAHLGKVGYVEASAAGMAFSNFLQRLRLGPECVPRFVWYFLNSVVAKDQVRLFSSTSTGLQNLSAKLIGDLVAPFPSIDEQWRIADFLDVTVAQLDAISQARMREADLLEERARSEISEYLFPGISAVADGNPSWPWIPTETTGRPLVRLALVAGLQGGLTVDAARDLSGDVVTRPYLRVANVQNGYLDLTSITEVVVPTAIARRSMLQFGDVLMTEGGDLDKLGRGALWSDQVPGCLHQNHVFAIRPDSERLDAQYLVYLTQSVHGRCYFESTGVRTTNLASTNSSKIMNFPIPLRSVAEQRSVVALCRAAVEYSDRANGLLQRQLDLLRERRQALITAAVTGQIDVTTARGAGVA
jgi:type I restriction enzyme S subunit